MALLIKSVKSVDYYVTAKLTVLEKLYSSRKRRTPWPREDLEAIRARDTSVCLPPLRHGKRYLHNPYRFSTLQGVHVVIYTAPDFICRYFHVAIYIYRLRSIRFIMECTSIRTETRARVTSSFIAPIKLPFRLLKYYQRLGDTQTLAHIVCALLTPDIPEAEKPKHKMVCKPLRDFPRKQ